MVAIAAGLIVTAVLRIRRYVERREQLMFLRGTIYWDFYFIGPENPFDKEAFETEEGNDTLHYDEGDPKFRKYAEFTTRSWALERFVTNLEIHLEHRTTRLSYHEISELYQILTDIKKFIQRRGEDSDVIPGIGQVHHLERFYKRFAAIKKLKLMPEPPWEAKPTPLTLKQRLVNLWWRLIAWLFFPW